MHPKLQTPNCQLLTKNQQPALFSLKIFLHNVVRFPDAGEISLYK